NILASPKQLDSWFQGYPRDVVIASHEMDDSVGMNNVIHESRQSGRCGTVLRVRVGPPATLPISARGDPNSSCWRGSRRRRGGGRGRRRGGFEIVNLQKSNACCIVYSTHDRRVISRP